MGSQETQSEYGDWAMLKNTQVTDERASVWDILLSDPFLSKPIVSSVF